MWVAEVKELRSQEWNGFVDSKSLRMRGISGGDRDR